MCSLMETIETIVVILAAIGLIIYFIAGFIER